MNYRYTLRNAEYRLCLEKNLDMCESDPEKPKAETENTKFDLQGLLHDSVNVIDFGRKNNLSSKVDRLHEELDIQNLAEISAEAQQYISSLQSRLSSMKKVYFKIKYPFFTLGFNHGICGALMVSLSEIYFVLDIVNT